MVFLSFCRHSFIDKKTISGSGKNLNYKLDALNYHMQSAVGINLALVQSLLSTLPYTPPPQVTGRYLTFICCLIDLWG